MDESLLEHNYPHGRMLTAHHGLFTVFKNRLSRGEFKHRRGFLEDKEAKKVARQIKRRKQREMLGPEQREKRRQRKELKKQKQNAKREGFAKLRLEKELAREAAKLAASSGVDAEVVKDALARAKEEEGEQGALGKKTAWEKEQDRKKKEGEESSSDSGTDDSYNSEDSSSSLASRGGRGKKARGGSEDSGLLWAGKVAEFFFTIF